MNFRLFMRAEKSTSIKNISRIRLSGHIAKAGAQPAESIAVFGPMSRMILSIAPYVFLEAI
jgi:hypothetical protein